MKFSGESIRPDEVNFTGSRFYKESKNLTTHHSSGFLLKTSSSYAERSSLRFRIGFHVPQFFGNGLQVARKEHLLTIGLMYKKHEENSAGR